MSAVGAAERRLREALGLGEPDARAAVTFLGAERVEVLRFLADGEEVHYAALGEAALVLSLRAGRLPLGTTDGVLRPLAVVAASPQVEDVTLAPGAALDLGGPLWPGAPFTAVLLDHLVPAPEGEPDPDAPLRLLPMTPAESAWRRARGTPALRERWRRHGTELHDPLRAAVPLTE